MKKVIRLYGHRWYISAKPSTLGSNYVLLERVQWRGELKRRGQVTSEIDVSLKDLPIDLDAPALDSLERTFTPEQ